jgi:MFS family permease
MIFSALGMTLGPIVAGTIFDMTGHYNWAFLICIILGALAIFLSLLLLRYKGKKDLAISG